MTQFDFSDDDFYERLKGLEDEQRAREKKLASFRKLFDDVIATESKPASEPPRGWWWGRRRNS